MKVLLALTFFFTFIIFLHFIFLPVVLIFVINRFVKLQWANGIKR